MEFIQQLFAGLLWLVRDFPQPENLQSLVQQIGPVWIYALLALIVFSETGLLVGFFLPGDSLLFACGLLAGIGVLDIWTLNITLIIAAIVGDAVNYSLGWWMGSRVYEKGNLWFIKHDHLLAAKAFYEKHGGPAIVLARFVPLVRTFTPFVAGVARMNYREFVWYNVAGGIGWVVSMTLAGLLLGKIPFVKENFEKIVYLIIILSIVPVVIGALRHRRGQKIAEPATTSGNTDFSP
ncbi:MAG: VTT domain-containing protein [Pirellulales bacterium]|nr:VTT domain-containing protein [Pirellulales bacterium]